MTIDPNDRVVATIILDVDGEVMQLMEGLQPHVRGYPLNIHITEAQLLTMNGFVRKRWEKSLEGTRVSYTMKPSPPPTDLTF